MALRKKHLELHFCFSQAQIDELMQTLHRLAGPSGPRR